MKQDDNLRAQIMVLAFVEHEGSMIFVSDKNIDQIMQKIANYVDTVIGEDEQSVHDDGKGDYAVAASWRNELRAEQRQRGGLS